jgi:hypothetical protein
MSARWIALLSVLFAVIAVPRVARADHPGAHTVPVAVLAFDSEDAEDQADALTGALRSRIRAAQGWSLIETTQSLGMLSAALKCQAKPLSADCQARIGDQIKAERFIYGYVSKGPQPGQVTADVHLYQKGKQETVIKESYADNLKDQNDDNLRKIAQRVLDRLGGTTVGTVVVKVEGAAEGGEVVVDGDKKVPLHRGTARIELAPGSHSIEVVSGSATTKRNVNVVAGKEALVEVSSTVTTEPPKEGEKSGFPTRKVIGGGLVVVGLALGALAVQQFLLYNDIQDRGTEVAKLIPNGEGPCGPSGNKEFCDLDGKATSASGIAIAAGSAGLVAVGVGAYLLFSDGGSRRERDAKTRLTPTLGGLSLSGSF